MTPKQREIEKEYGEPFADVVRGYAEMGYSRSDVAGILGYSRPHFTRCVLPALPPMPWPSRGRGNAVRDGIERRRENLGWRVSLSRARRLSLALQEVSA